MLNEDNMETNQDVSEVTIYNCHGKILVWSSEDVQLLREKYRIVGSLSGCFPRKSRQNSQLGIPLNLSKIEAKFILNFVNSKMLDQSNFPTDVDLSGYKEKIKDERLKQYEIQKRLKQEQKLIDLDMMATDIKRGKQLKLEKQEKKNNLTKIDSIETSQPMATCPNPNIARVECKNTADSVCSMDMSSTAKAQHTVVDFEQFKLSEIEKVERYGTEQTWVRLPEKSQFDFRYPLLSSSDIELSADENIQYEVFRDLHHQGYFLTDGMKFGGHFLVYPGDPGLYHSTYIAYCVPFQKNLSLTDYSALGRLATSVKKTLLLCSLDENNDVIYSSIAWSGLA
ncbi:unnamed protein product [Clavelina lepadiformis]|uniref:tRNA-splicing endonuclease subunit Sen34 n=1 Tax=Clavelina lepadiformis TaxID=159417 RepID=A0ABP0GUV9_CLALP